MVSTPPMPTRCIASRSAVMPALVTLPFIQCHHVCGRAEAGGEANPAAKGSTASGAPSGAALEKTCERPRQKRMAKIFMVMPIEYADAALVKNNFYPDQPDKVGHLSPIYLFDLFCSRRANIVGLTKFGIGEQIETG